MIEKSKKRMEKNSFSFINLFILLFSLFQSSFISMYLVNCFSTIIDLSNDLGNLAGYTHRIGELVEVFNETNEKKKLE